ncbi:MAG: RNA polymerase sigma factor [Patescibacteria group bacterium]
MKDHLKLDENMEQELVARAKQDEAGFTELYNYFFPKIYGYIYKRVGQRQACEDIVSEVFMKVFVNLEKYESRGFSFSSWLYKIATNRLIDYYREQGKKATVDVEKVLHIKSVDDTSHQVEINLEVEKVKKIINELPDKYQEVLNLKFFGELSNIEIARILNITENNAGIIIFRALKKFRAHYHQKNIDHENNVGAGFKPAQRAAQAQFDKK